MTALDTFQLFPALDPATEEALTESIRRFGVLVPIISDQDGNLLDGHHRRRIAAELGVVCPGHVVEVPVGASPVEIAATLNLDRRQMDRDQRREIVAHLRSEGYSLRSIADAVGVSHPTVKEDLESIGKDLPMPETVRTSDGRTYPASRPKPEPVDVSNDTDRDPVDLIWDTDAEEFVDDQADELYDEHFDDTSASSDDEPDTANTTYATLDALAAQSVDVQRARLAQTTWRLMAQLGQGLLALDPALVAQVVESDEEWDAFDAMAKRAAGWFAELNTHKPDGRLRAV